ncbi:MAG: DNA repair protein RadC [Bacteroidales bacterium]|nr:DNA repair protein RadC [Bacteroidales bacterium]
MGDYKNLRIKDWALEDRPREKLLSKGLKSLTDAELLAILIGSGQKNESAVEVAKKVLNLAQNNLNELGKLSINEFETVKGIGETKAITLISALELGRRRKLSESKEKYKIGGSKDAFNYMQPFLEDLSYEEFWVIYMNRSNRVIDQVKISQGGISGTVIDVRIILKHAIEKLASTIIICHNHPSGNLQPSKSDIQITSKLKEAAKFHDVELLDHLIISDSSYYSFADEGII